MMLAGRCLSGLASAVLGGWKLWPTRVLAIEARVRTQTRTATTFLRPTAAGKGDAKGVERGNSEVVGGTGKFTGIIGTGDYFQPTFRLRRMTSGAGGCEQQDQLEASLMDTRGRNDDA